MARIELGTIYKVEIIRSHETGSNIIETIYFDNEAEANEFALNYNNTRNEYYGARDHNIANVLRVY